MREVWLASVAICAMAQVVAASETENVWAELGLPAFEARPVLEMPEVSVPLANESALTTPVSAYGIGESIELGLTGEISFEPEHSSVLGLHVAWSSGTTLDVSHARTRMILESSDSLGLGLAANKGSLETTFGGVGIVASFATVASVR